MIYSFKVPGTCHIVQVSDIPGAKSKWFLCQTAASGMQMELGWFFSADSTICWRDDHGWRSITTSYLAVTVKISNWHVNAGMGGSNADVEWFFHQACWVSCSWWIFPLCTTLFFLLHVHSAYMICNHVITCMYSEYTEGTVYYMCI
jgi:hypothetical protein